MTPQQHLELVVGRLDHRWKIVKNDYNPPEVRLPEAIAMAGDIAVLCALLGGWKP